LLVNDVRGVAYPAMGGGKVDLEKEPSPLPSFLSAPIVESNRSVSFRLSGSLYLARRPGFWACAYGEHSIAPKTASANPANAKVRNRQMIGRPTIL